MSQVVTIPYFPDSGDYILLLTLVRLILLPLLSSFFFSIAPNMISSQRTRQFTSANAASNLECLQYR